jgi:hypothetical protein
VVLDLPENAVKEQLLSGNNGFTTDTLNTVVSPGRMAELKGSPRVTTRWRSRHGSVRNSVKAYYKKQSR